MDQEENIWNEIEYQCACWNYVYNYNNPKKERWIVLDELLEEKFKKYNGVEKKMNQVEKEYVRGYYEAFKKTEIKIKSIIQDLEEEIIGMGYKDIIKKE